MFLRFWDYSQRFAGSYVKPKTPKIGRSVPASVTRFSARISAVLRAKANLRWHLRSCVRRCLCYVYLMPTGPELIELRDVLLNHALDPNSDVQRRMVEYLFERIFADEACAFISATEVMDAVYPPGVQTAKDIKKATHDLKRDVGNKFTEFYDGSSQRPKALTLNVKYRAHFAEKRNYMLKFPPYQPKLSAPDWVARFWEPHLPPHGVAKILYPEPVFLMDKRETFFRNTAIGTKPNASALAYLNIPTPLTTGYSYVPSGVVHAMLALTKTLRAYHHRPDSPDYATVEPDAYQPPNDNKDLILISSLSSTDLVATIQGGQKMLVNTKGVEIAGKMYEDTADKKWGVLTRTRHSHRTITMITAKHGRCVEAMTTFLTLPKQLEALAQRPEFNRAFPQTFQILFRMPVFQTPGGPSVTDAVVAEVSLPLNDDATED